MKAVMAVASPTAHEKILGAVPNMMRILRLSERVVVMMAMVMVMVFLGCIRPDELHLLLIPITLSIAMLRPVAAFPQVEWALLTKLARVSSLDEVALDPPPDSSEDTLDALALGMTELSGFFRLGVVSDGVFFSHVGGDLQVAG